jgi:hypothetical protein
MNIFDARNMDRVYNNTATHELILDIAKTIIEAAAREQKTLTYKILVTRSSELDLNKAISYFMDLGYNVDKESEDNEIAVIDDSKNYFRKKDLGLKKITISWGGK